MGCLSVVASTPYSQFSCSAERVGSKLFLSARALGGGVSCTAALAGDSMMAKAKKVGDELTVRCSLICTVNSSAFLNVRPNTLWLSSEALSSMDFDVISNVRWVIE